MNLRNFGYDRNTFRLDHHRKLQRGALFACLLEACASKPLPRAESFEVMSCRTMVRRMALCLCCASSTVGEAAGKWGVILDLRAVTMWLLLRRAANIIVLLNNDTAPAPGWLEHMVSVLRQIRKLGW